MARESIRSEAAWAPVDACTLPDAARPARFAEFDALFGAVREVRREGPGWLRLRLTGGGGVEERAGELAAREARCCSFFAFAVRREGGEVVVDVRVPPERATVLDGLAARAGAVAGERG